MYQLFLEHEIQCMKIDQYVMCEFAKCDIAIMESADDDSYILEKSNTASGNGVKGIVASFLSLIGKIIDKIRSLFGKHKTLLGQIKLRGDEKETVEVYDIDGYINQFERTTKACLTAINSISSSTDNNKIKNEYEKSVDEINDMTERIRNKYGWDRHKLSARAAKEYASKAEAHTVKILNDLGNKIKSVAEKASKKSKTDIGAKYIYDIVSKLNKYATIVANTSSKAIVSNITKIKDFFDKNGYKITAAASFGIAAAAGGVLVHDVNNRMTASPWKTKTLKHFSNEEQVTIRTILAKLRDDEDASRSRLTELCKDDKERDLIKRLFDYIDAKNAKLPANVLKSLFSKRNNKNNDNAEKPVQPDKPRYKVTQRMKLSNLRKMEAWRNLTEADRMVINIIANEMKKDDPNALLTKDTMKAYCRNSAQEEAVDRLFEISGNLVNEKVDFLEMFM